MISAYEHDTEIPQRAIVVTGPFMPASAQQEFHERCERVDKLEILTFDAHIELLMEQASSVVAMGGYNTFCEILSFDKPALIVPRTVPRREQLIRASRAVVLGLVNMLDPSADRDPVRMAEALKTLPHKSPPSAHSIVGMLDGHECIADLVRKHIESIPVDGSKIA